MKIASGRCWVDPSRKVVGDGYVNAGVTSAHRFSYGVFIGLIPKGMHVDHLCENRACYSPFHLEAVTPSENSKRALRNLYRRVTGKEYT